MRPLPKIEQLGTGALIKTLDSYPFHILTAAHVLAGSGAGRINFDLTRDGSTKTRVPIPIKSQGVYSNPSYSWPTATPANDIAIYRLVDPDQPEPTRLLVPPKSATSWLPNIYSDADERGITTFVGYGDHGVGNTGATKAANDLKRVGFNRIERGTPDMTTSPASRTLAFDFDNGQQQNDAFGYEGNDAPVPDLGLGEIESQIAQGDSGGPWFKVVGSNYAIVGITSEMFRYPTFPFSTPDIDWTQNSTYGEVGIGTRVSKFASFIQDNTNTGIYDLVLDMSHQVYGQDIDDTLTITARNITGRLVLTVTGGGVPSLEGEYFSAPASDIKSLTIRGTSDNETFVIEGPLGLAGDGNISIRGAAGDDNVIIKNLDGPGVGDFLGKIDVDCGNGSDTVTIDNSDSTLPLVDSATRYTLKGDNDQQLYRGGGRPTATFVDAEKLTLKTGSQPDVIRIEGSLSGLTVGQGVRGLVVESNDGDDSFYVDGVSGKLEMTLTAGAGDDSLYIQSGHANNPAHSGFDKLLSISGGQLTVNGTNGLAVREVTQSGGTLAGTATVSASAALAWTGGVMKDNGITEALENSTVTITGPVTLNHRLFQSAGYATWAGDISGDGWGELKNTGVLLTSGKQVNLAGHLTSSGVLSPGGPAGLGHVIVSRQYTDSGSLNVDVGPEGDGSDQITADTVALSGTLVPVSFAGFPAKFYTVVKNLSTLPGGAFANAPHEQVLVIDSKRYKMLYESDQTNWGKAVLRRVVDVGDLTWEDKNLNGLREPYVPPTYQNPNGSGDPVIAGVPIGLYRASDDVLMAGTVSGSDGRYRFVDVVVDDYYLRFNTPGPDWRLTIESSGTSDDNSDPRRLTGKTDTFTLSPLADDMTRDAGLYRLGAIGDKVWDDYIFSDTGGIQSQDGNSGFADLTVTLTDEFGVALRTTVTNPSGGYVFTHLELRDAAFQPVKYRVLFTKRPDSGALQYRFSPMDRGGDDRRDSDADPATGLTGVYTFSRSGEGNATVDCGIQTYIPPSGPGWFAAYDLRPDERADAVVPAGPGWSVAPDLWPDTPDGLQIRCWLYGVELAG